MPYVSDCRHGSDFIETQELVERLGAAFGRIVTGGSVDDLRDLVERAEQLAAAGDALQTRA